MKNKIDVLFDLLKCALFDKELDVETKESAAAQSEILYKMSKHHDVAHLVQYAFKKSEIPFADEQIEYDFLKAQVMSVMRYEDLKLALANISALFEEEKIMFIPLKGAVIRQFYPEPWMRTSCDLDILVHEEDLDRAEMALVEKLNYTSKGEKGYHDISLYSDTGVHLELHFNIKENMENIDGILEKVWEYSSPKVEGGFECVLTNEFFMFQIVAHMSYHVAGGGCSLRNFSDLYCLENKLEFDRKKFVSILEGCRLNKFYDTVLRLSKVWFSDGVHDETTAMLQKYLLAGGVYGTVKNQIASQSAERSKVSYVINRIFMPYDLMVVRYPQIKGKKYLLPFYQIKRWIEYVLGSKKKDTSLTLSVLNDVSKEEVRFASELFERLEIDIKKA